MPPVLGAGDTVGDKAVETHIICVLPQDLLVTEGRG